jgi:hypothetical protein
MTWQTLSGRGARRVRPGGIGQSEELMLRQSVYARETRSLARGHARRWTVGLERRQRVGARQVSDKILHIRMGSGEDDRKGTKTQTRSRLIRDMPGKLVARWLGQGRWLMP